MADCSVEGCERPHEARGWCHGHYLRWTRTGDVQPEVPLTPRVRGECAVDPCDRVAAIRGLCRTHQTRELTYGDARAETPIGQIPRSVKGGPRRSRGWSTNGYRYVPVHAEEQHLTADAPYEAEHRLVMARDLGRPLRADESVHHRNGDRTDNRPENLELWSTAQPAGQRVSDKILWAVELLTRYAPELLVESSGRCRPEAHHRHQTGSTERS